MDAFDAHATSRRLGQRRILLTRLPMGTRVPSFESCSRDGRLANRLIARARKIMEDAPSIPLRAPCDVQFLNDPSPLANKFMRRTG